MSWLGFFYGGNIAGAVGGCLLAGFYLLRVHDMVTATYVAAAINITVASVAFGLAARTQHTAPDAARARASSLTAPRRRPMFRVSSFVFRVWNPEPGTRNAEPKVHPDHGRCMSPSRSLAYVRWAPR